SGSIETTVRLPVNAVATFQLTATVAAGAFGRLVNTVTAQNPAGFGNTAPVSATDTDTITRNADLAITKTGPASVVPGNAATYTITVTNGGPASADKGSGGGPPPPGATRRSHTRPRTPGLPRAARSPAAGGAPHHTNA